MKRFNDFYEAYHFLSDHEMVKSNLYGKNGMTKYKGNFFTRCLTIEVIKVNPETLYIDNNETLNTLTQVRLEFKRAFLNLDETEIVQFEHDIRLDCVADTYEAAIIKLANLVDKYYEDNGEEKKLIDEEIYKALEKECSEIKGMVFNEEICEIILDHIIKYAELGINSDKKILNFIKNDLVILDELRDAYNLLLEGNDEVRKNVIDCIIKGNEEDIIGELYGCGSWCQVYLSRKALYLIWD